MRDGRPHVMLKLAVSADGKAGAAGRKPVAITGEAARARVHLMRAQADAILVGIGTVLADDPPLTCRLPGMLERSPVRVVLDARLRVPLAGGGDRDRARDRRPGCSPRRRHRRWRRKSLRASGVEVFRVAAKDGRLDLAQVLKVLAERGITRLMVEGGPTVAAAFLQADLVDELALFRSPNEIGQGHRRAGGPAALRADAIATPEVAGVGRRRRRYARNVRAGVNVHRNRHRHRRGRRVEPQAEGLRRLKIACGYDRASIAIGASIACSGVCLTVVEHRRRQRRTSFAVDAAAETLAITTAGRWRTGTRLNLERALKIGDELGGHIVAGHVDGIAELISREDLPDMARLTFRAPVPS